MNTLQLSDSNFLGYDHMFFAPVTNHATEDPVAAVPVQESRSIAHTSMPATPDELALEPPPRDTYQHPDGQHILVAAPPRLHERQMADTDAPASHAPNYGIPPGESTARLAAQHVDPVKSRHRYATRLQHNIRQPKVRTDGAVNYSAARTPAVEPTSHVSGMKIPLWKQAMNDEFQALQKKQDLASCSPSTWPQ